MMCLAGFDAATGLRKQPHAKTKAATHIEQLDGGPGQKQCDWKGDPIEPKRDELAHSPRPTGKPSDFGGDSVGDGSSANAEPKLMATSTEADNPGIPDIELPPESIPPSPTPKDKGNAAGPSSPAKKPPPSPLHDTIERIHKDLEQVGKAIEKTEADAPVTPSERKTWQDHWERIQKDLDNIARTIKKTFSDAFLAVTPRSQTPVPPPEQPVAVADPLAVPTQPTEKAKKAADKKAKRDAKRKAREAKKQLKKAAKRDKKERKRAQKELKKAQKARP